MACTVGCVCSIGTESHMVGLTPMFCASSPVTDHERMIRAVGMFGHVGMYIVRRCLTACSGCYPGIVGLGCQSSTHTLTLRRFHSLRRKVVAAHVSEFMGQCVPWAASIQGRAVFDALREGCSVEPWDEDEW